jgi:hypothetical protein
MCIHFLAQNVQHSQRLKPRQGSDLQRDIPPQISPQAAAPDFGMVPDALLVEDFRENNQCGGSSTCCSMALLRPWGLGYMESPIPMDSRLLVDGDLCGDPARS